MIRDHLMELTIYIHSRKALLGTILEMVYLYME